MGKTYRAAIIGVGAIADIHALAMGELENLELVAGSCRTEAKGQAFADRFGCRWYRDYEELLDEARPDFVTIATPSGFHLEPLEACARRGIHVLCEKPLEISVRRVDRMIQVARESGIRLGGIFPQRFNPVLRVVHGAAAQGRFGDLAVVNAYVPWWRDDAYYAPDRWQGTLALDGGGAMMNQSIHGVDAAQWLASAAIPDLPPGGNPVREIFAFTAKRGHDPEPDRGGGHGGRRLAAARRRPGTDPGGHLHVSRFAEATSVGGERRDRGSAGRRARHLGLRPGAGRGRRCAPAFLRGDPQRRGSRRSHGHRLQPPHREHPGIRGLAGGRRQFPVGRSRVPQGGGHHRGHLRVGPDRPRRGRGELKRVAPYETEEGTHKWCRYAISRGQ